MRAKEAGIPFIKLQNKHVLYESSTSSPKKNSGRATFDTFQSKVVGCNGLKPSPPSLLHSFFVLRQWPHPLKMHTCWPEGAFVRVGRRVWHRLCTCAFEGAFVCVGRRVWHRLCICVFKGAFVLAGRCVRHWLCMCALKGVCVWCVCLCVCVFVCVCVCVCVCVQMCQRVYKRLKSLRTRT